MIVRRYGSLVQSVAPNFDSRALTEIGFRRDHRTSHSAEEFFATHQRVRGHDFVASTEGHVQDEAEQRLLSDLEGQLHDLESALGDGELLLVESEQGSDYPKTGTQTRTVVIEGENRLHFTTTVHPPLRVGVYRKANVAA